MVYSSKADRVIVFGGGFDLNNLTNETWVFDLNTTLWTKVAPNP
jgi:hypothetical protein